MYLKAELFENSSGEIVVEDDGTEKVFSFTYTDGTLTVASEDGDIICNRSLSEDGKEKNDFEAFGIAIQEVGGYIN